MSRFNSDNHYIYCCGQQSLIINGVALIVKTKKSLNTVLGCNLKNDRMILVHFQGKPFKFIVVEVFAPTTNGEEADVERFYEDLQDLLEHTDRQTDRQTHTHTYPFHHRALECKSRNSRDPWSIRQLCPWNTK